MFQCVKCRIEKPIDEFYANETKLGHNSTCKECIRKLRLSRMASAEWRKDNSEYASNYMRNYVLDPRKRAKIMWNKARNRSQNFSLTLARVEVALLIGVCERSGFLFQFGPHEKYRVHPFSPSLDRRNPFGPYSDENVQVVCSAYNLGKNQMTDEEYIQFCRRVVAVADERGITK